MIIDGISINIKINTLIKLNKGAKKKRRKLITFYMFFPVRSWTWEHAFNSY